MLFQTGYFLSFFYTYYHFISKEPYRLQSVLTGCASIVLSPIGIQHYLEISPPSYSYSVWATHTYLIYTLLDMIIGRIYYPNYLTPLETWIHHSVSGWYAYYCIRHHRCDLFSQVLIVEVSTILLSLMRLFPSHFRTPWIQKILFPFLFFMFRIFFLNQRLWREANKRSLERHEIILSIAFSALNVVWLTTHLRKYWFGIRRSRKTIS